MVCIFSIRYRKLSIPGIKSVQSDSSETLAKLAGRRAYSDKSKGSTGQQATQSIGVCDSATISGKTLYLLLIRMEPFIRTSFPPPKSTGCVRAHINVYRDIGLGARLRIHLLQTKSACLMSSLRQIENNAIMVGHTAHNLLTTGSDSGTNHRKSARRRHLLDRLGGDDKLRPHALARLHNICNAETAHSEFWSIVLAPGRQQIGPGIELSALNVYVYDFQ